MFGGLDSGIVSKVGELFGGDKKPKTSTKDSFGTATDTILGTDWGHASLFQIKELKLKKAITLDNIFNNPSSLHLLNASIQNIETATITETPIEEWIGGQWVYTHGRPEMRQITFTFRDASNSWLYRNLNAVKNAVRNMYPDDQKWAIRVDTHGDIVAGNANSGRYQTDSDEYKSFGTLIQTQHAILESISSVSLDQSNYDGFLTFSVTFKYINAQHNDSFEGSVNGGVAKNTKTVGSK